MIGRPPPVDAQPVTHIARWRVLETNKGSRHLVGWAIEDSSGRVSSALQTFDVEKGEGRTSSGRIYRLTGSTDHDGDAQYVWARWCELNSVTSFRDVSAEYNCVALKRDDL